MTLKTDFRETPAGKPAPFRFAPTFKIDLVFSLAYVFLFIQLWARAEITIVTGVGAGLFGLLLTLCYAGKVYIIASLNEGGGDARTYVISSDLVTTGLYAFSRNPTYLLTLIQCVLWSALLIFLQLFAPFEPLVLAISIVLPALFFAITERVITREDAALSAAHPEAFAAYSKQVGRWFGRGRA
jgi:protein-S-isoprenylcysteine O-methyltransferase Ste14